MKSLLFALAICSASLLPAKLSGNTHASDMLERSVVRVLRVGADFDYLNPWNAPKQLSATGSGFVTKSGHVFTNAHVVENMFYIQVKLAGYPRSFPARLVAVADDCDLAVLKVDDPLFAQVSKPISWAQSMPSLRDEVIVAGFPMGGEQLSVSQGRITRFEVTPYAHQGEKLLVCQTDAYAAPGSSGGPVLSSQSGDVIGVIHQGSFSGAPWVQMIPIEIVSHFIAGLNEGSYRGFFSPGFRWRHLESSAQRRYYSVPAHQTGVIVTEVARCSPLRDMLKRGDVITAVNEHTIYNDGTYEYKQGHYFSFDHLFKTAREGMEIKIEFLRDGESRQIILPVHYSEKSVPVIPPIEYGKAPSYYIYGGLVFQPLTRNYLEALLADDWRPRALIGRLDEYLKECERVGEQREIVILSQVLAGDCNNGFHGARAWVIDRVCGEPIQSMQELIERIEACTDPFVVIESDDGRELVLDREEVLKEGDKILHRHGIYRPCSTDLIKT